MILYKSLICLSLGGTEWKVPPKGNRVQSTDNTDLGIQMTDTTNQAKWTREGLQEVCL